MCTILRLSSEPWAQILDSLEASDVLSLILAGNKKLATLVSRNWRNVELRSKPLRRFPLSLFKRLDLHSISIAPSSETPALALRDVELAKKSLVTHEALKTLKLHFLEALFILNLEIDSLADLFPSLRVFEISGHNNTVEDWMLRALPPFLEKLVIAPLDGAPVGYLYHILLPQTLTHLSIKGSVCGDSIQSSLPGSLRFLELTIEGHPDLLAHLPSKIEVCKLDVRSGVRARATIELSTMPRSIKSLWLNYQWGINFTLENVLHEGLEEIEVLPRFSLIPDKMPSTLKRAPTSHYRDTYVVSKPGDAKPKLEHLELKSVHISPQMLRFVAQNLKTLLAPPGITLPEQPTKSLLPSLQTLDATLHYETLKVLPTGLTSLWIRNLTEGVLSADDLACLPRSLESFAIDAQHLANAEALSGLNRARIGLKCLVVFKVSAAYFKSPKFLLDLPSSMQRLSITGGFKDDVKELRWMKNLSSLTQLSRLDINVSMRVLTNLGEALAALPHSLKMLSLVKLNSFETTALSHLPPNLVHLRIVDSSKSITSQHFKNLPQDLGILSLTSDAPLSADLISFLPCTISQLSVHLMKHGKLQGPMNTAIGSYWSRDPTWKDYTGPINRDLQRQVLARFMGAAN